VPSPNIWHHTTTYELENRAADPAGRLSRALRERVEWSGRTVLDIGCGAGFHLPFLAADAGRALGVEPHPDLARIARRRVRRLPHVEVLDGTAQSLPLPAASIDVVHARWAYFFGPGCEPGLAELERVVRRGGVALVVDNDPTRSTFGEWFRRGYPDLPPAAEVERFWIDRGWARTRVDMDWAFTERADLEAVVRIELPTTLAEEVVLTHRGTEVDYAVNLWSRTY